MLIRLVTGCPWVTVERLLGGQVSDATLRSRSDEREAAGVFERVAAEVVAAHDRVVGLDLGDVCVDESVHEAPCGGAGTGRNPVDRQELGWK